MTWAQGAWPGAVLYTLMYVSELADVASAEVLRICEQSRDNNERDGITGLLVFDGQAFCQLVEGPPVAISALLERLHNDPRHARMKTLFFGPSTAGHRHFPSWRLGYAYVADPATLMRLADLSGDHAVAALAELAPGLETR